MYAYCQDGWSGPTDIAMFERAGMLPYPNPSTGLVNFKTEVDVEVYDIVGRLILNSSKVSRIELNKGVYLIKISKESLNVTTKLIIE